jgi:hypothetical protein
MTGYLKSNNGSRSSKRLWGSILVGFGLEMKLALFHFSLFKLVATPFDYLDACVNSTIYAGCALLGIGVVELFGKKNV